MKHVLAVISITALFLSAGLSVGWAKDYAHQTSVGNMEFAWTVDGDMLHVKISGKTTGWVGIGFNPSAYMQDANYILGYVKGDDVTISDEFGDSRYGHTSDEKLGGKSDVTVVAGSEAKGVTTLEFTLPLNSGDKYDGVITPDGKTVVLLAYGSSRDSLISKHKFRKGITVNLANGTVE